MADGTAHAPGGRRRRRLAWALLATGAALATTACSAPRAAIRSVPADVGRPRFLSVSNEAQAPLIVGTDAGAYVSTDAGRTWRRSDAVAGGARALAYTRGAALLATAGRLEATDLSLGRPARPVRSWPGEGPIVALASSPRRARVWATVEGASPRLWYSNDDGDRWWPLPARGLCDRPRALAATAPPGAIDRLYVACGEGGVLVSRDLGTTFHRLDGPARAVDVATTPADPSLLVVAAPVVTVSRDAGATWRPTGLSASRVALDPRNPALVFAIAENGRLHASTDGGRSF